MPLTAAQQDAVFDDTAGVGRLKEVTLAVRDDPADPASSGYLGARVKRADANVTKLVATVVTEADFLRPEDGEDTVRKAILSLATRGAVAATEARLAAIEATLAQILAKLPA